MAEYLIQGESLTSIGDEIRTLQDLTTVLKPNEMVTNLSSANSEVNTQTDIIAQISAALSGKSVDSGAIPTVEQATPTISINSNGLITATSIQLSGQVTGGTKTATQQLNTLGTTSITPDTYAKTAAEAGVYTTGVITVEPIPDIYKNTTDATASINDILSGKTAYTAEGKIVGTIETKEENDLIAEGATITTPAGYYPLPVSKTISNSIQNDPAITIDSNGLITTTITQTAGYVSGESKSNTRQLNTINETIITPTKEMQTAAVSGFYTTGNITVLGDENLIAENIKEGTTIFGVTGTFLGQETPEAVEIIIENEIDESGSCWYIDNKYQLQNIPISLGTTNFICAYNSPLTISGNFYGLQANSNCLQANEILTINSESSIHIKLIPLEEIILEQEEEL